MIKSVSCNTYPEHNDKGGIKHTGNVLNDLNYNYKESTRDLLINGLWKEQVITNGIPEYTLNIGSLAVPI